MNAAWGGLRLAVGTLTMIPVGHIPPPTRRVGAWSMALAPVAALPLGVLVAATCLLGRWLALPALVTASLSIGALALATRALHLDGLADTADGIGAGWDRERALREERPHRLDEPRPNGVGDRGGARPRRDIRALFHAEGLV